MSENNTVNYSTVYEYISFPVIVSIMEFACTEVYISSNNVLPVKCFTNDINLVLGHPSFR